MNAFVIAPLNRVKKRPVGYNFNKTFYKGNWENKNKISDRRTLLLCSHNFEKNVFPPTLYKGKKESDWKKEAIPFFLGRTKTKPSTFSWK